MSKPIAPRAKLHTDDIVGDQVAGFTSDSPIVVDAPASSAQLDHEAFMAQEVQVCFSPPANENEPLFVETNVNNSYRLIPRDGNTYSVKRYHIEALCHAKDARVEQRAVVGRSGFAEGMQEIAIARSCYPFSVIHDPSGQKGMDWIKTELSRPL